MMTPHTDRASQPMELHPQIHLRCRIPLLYRTTYRPIHQFKWQQWVNNSICRWCHQIPFFNQTIICSSNRIWWWWDHQTLLVMQAWCPLRRILLLIRTIHLDQRAWFNIWVSFKPLVCFKIWVSLFPTYHWVSVEAYYPELRVYLCIVFTLDAIISYYLVL